MSGAAAGLALLVAAVFLPTGVPLMWLAALTPITAALVAAATAGSFMHWRKVTGRVAMHGGILTAALLVLIAAQIPRFAETVSLARVGSVEVLLSAEAWRAAFDVTSPARSALEQWAPALVAAGEMVGRDRLWILVLADIALLVGVSWWMTRRALAAPFCVACRSWCVRERGVLARSGHAAAPATVRQRAAARDWRYFRDLGPAQGGPSLRFDLDRCPRCKRSNAISVMWERPLWRDRCLVGHLRLGSDDVRTILGLVEAEPKPQAA